MNIMSYHDKTVTAQGGGGGNLVATLDAEAGAWDALIRSEGRGIFYSNIPY